MASFFYSVNIYVRFVKCYYVVNLKEFYFEKYINCLCRKYL
jgi:hypothetical protein